MMAAIEITGGANAGNSAFYNGARTAAFRN